MLHLFNELRKYDLQLFGGFSKCSNVADEMAITLTVDTRKRFIWSQYDRYVYDFDGKIVGSFESIPINVIRIHMYRNSHIRYYRRRKTIYSEFSDMNVWFDVLNTSNMSVVFSSFGILRRRYVLSRTNSHIIYLFKR